MDAYSHYYVVHNVPLVAIFGLETPEESEGAEEEARYPGFHEHGFSFTSELPPVAGSPADALRRAFQDLDAKDAAWNGRPGPGKMGSTSFTYRNIGRTVTLPPHKAPQPSQSDLEDLPSTWQVFLHSPISPLTPTSNLYPDGILNPVWASKHQCLVPSAILSFFTFTIDPSRSTLEDNALKAQINQLKSWLAETRYTTRLVVVLFCDEPAPVSSVVERLGNIRRSTNLDTKTLVYMPGGLSVDETRAYVGSLLSNIRPSCIEYYRDLSKHARRKKNRANIPQPTLPPSSGTSQTLSARGWNVRYEVKLGFFAEFRGEMDAAERNYEQAYEDLMDGDVFEGISNWSQRFNQARTLADILAIRILRCLLWTNQTTSAAQSWANHKYRMQDIVDKKGKGSSTYAWQAWEATWSMIMAQLIERAEIPFFHIPAPSAQTELAAPNIYAPPERSLTKETLVSPWDHLHHPGYWYSRSAQRSESRRMLANSIPSEDRRPPGESPASSLASRSHLYDSYMVPDPHIEYAESLAPQGLHSTLIVNAYSKAILSMQNREQTRMDQELRFKEVQHLVRNGQWNAADALLRPYFESCTYAQSGWWDIWKEILLLGSAVAKQLKDGNLLLLVNWQLQSLYLDLPDQQRPNLATSIQDLVLPTKPNLTLDIRTTVPVFRASFQFAQSSACVGDSLKCQLVVRSDASAQSGPFTLSSLVVHFSGSTALTHIKLQHDPDTAKYTGSVSGRPKLFQQVELDTDSPDTAVSGKADLTIDSDAVHVYELSIIPNEAQPLTVSVVRTIIDHEHYSLDVEQALYELRSPPSHWWTPKGDGLFARKPLYFERYRTIDVKPRPPKLEVSLPDHLGTYYTDERAIVTIRTTNAESEQADVRLKVRIVNSNLEATVGWTDGKRESSVLVGETGMILPQRDLGMMEAAASQDVVLSIERLSQMADVVLDIEAVYTLASKPNTIITKSIKQTLSFIRPFEANYETTAAVHPVAWPSYFALASDDTAAGLSQRAHVATKIASFAKEPVFIEHVELMHVGSADASIVAHTEATSVHTPTEMQPGEETTRQFRVDVQKLHLEDRSIASVPLALAITWRRKTSSASGSRNTPSATTVVTTLAAAPVPFDFAKPRALASARLGSLTEVSRPTPVVQMTYMLENPSDYMLTFGVTMDASDQFAFAGPKTTSMQLTPFSRGEVKFMLLPLLRGGWISPVVRVNDIGFKETLKVIAADGVRSEKGRCLVWIPELEKEEDKR